MLKFYAIGSILGIEDLQETTDTLNHSGERRTKKNAQKA
jgi:hypothetical protein